MDEVFSLSRSTAGEKRRSWGRVISRRHAGSYLRASSHQRCAWKVAQRSQGGGMTQDASEVTRSASQRSLIRVLGLEQVQQACRRAPALASANRVTSAQHSRSRKVDNRRIS
jgi:hypothetical protein